MADRRPLGLPPPPNPAERHVADFGLRLSGFDLFRLVRALRRQARESRIKVRKTAERGQLRDGQRDHNEAVAEICDRAADQLAAQMPPERQPWMAKRDDADG